MKMISMYKINFNVAFLSLFILLCWLNQAQAQYLVYDNSKNFYKLKSPLSLKGLDKDSTCILLNKAIKNNDRKAIKKIIEADSSNILTLIKISDEVKTRTPTGTEFEDQYSFKEVMDEVIQNMKLEYWSFVFYFQYLNELKLKSLSKILKNYDGGYLAWFPLYLDKYQEFLILFRHFLADDFLIKNYSKIKIDEFIHFLYLRFNDASFIDLKDDFFNSGWYASQIKKIPDTSFVNISNSSIFITASSQLSPKYKAANVKDMDMNTVWAEGNNNDGSGEWLKIQLKEKEFVHNLILFPGHSKSNKLFKANNRIKKLELSFNGKKQIYFIKDIFIPAILPINSFTNGIKITILETYKGYKYNDLCIGEVMLTKK